MNLYNFDLLPILLALIIIVCVVLWVAIRNYKNFILMFFLIPLALYSGWTVYSTVDKLLGYPTIDLFEKDTMYIAHFENPDIDEWIYVWVLKPGDARPKAIMIPNTKKNQEELNEAEQKASDGVQVFMEVTPDGSGQTAGGEINTYDFQQNWGSAEKDAQRERDAEEERERIMPGPAERIIVPPSQRPSLNIDETREDEFGGNTQIIWREDETEKESNPFQDWNEIWDYKGNQEIAP